MHHPMHVLDAPARTVLYYVLRCQQ